MEMDSLGSQSFNNLRYYMRCEGGAVQTAEKDGKFYVITDESAMSMFLDEDDVDGHPLSSALEFDSYQERADYLMKRFGPGEQERR